VNLIAFAFLVNAFVNGRSQLVLRTRRDGERFTCGAVNTEGKFEDLFGCYSGKGFPLVSGANQIKISPTR